MGTWSRLKYRKLRDTVRVGDGVYITDSKFEGKNSVASGSQVIKSEMGYASYCASNTFIRNTKIGRYCSIGKNVRIVDKTHPIDDFVSTHPAFYSSQNVTGVSYAQKSLFIETLYAVDSKWSVEIGNDVWVCDNAMILGGHRIGDGAIIAAGAVVTKDVPPYAIYGGVPAQLIRYRFDKETREFLENSKWWDKGEEWIKANVKLFENVEYFVTNAE